MVPDTTGARAALCGDPGAADFARGHVPGDRPLHRYRCGAFQLLAQMALLGELPAPLTGPRVRAALTAVMQRLLDAPGTFDDEGWLTVGFCGHQPHLGESYISTGSLYLCAGVLLPLGLGPADAFWSGAAEDWTARRIWRGEDAAADHAI